MGDRKLHISRNAKLRIFSACAAISLLVIIALPALLFPRIAETRHTKLSAVSSESGSIEFSLDPKLQASKVSREELSLTPSLVVGDAVRDSSYMGPPNGDHDGIAIGIRVSATAGPSAGHRGTSMERNNGSGGVMTHGSEWKEGNPGMADAARGRDGDGDTVNGEDAVEMSDDGGSGTVSGATDRIEEDTSSEWAGGRERRKGKSASNWQVNEEEATRVSSSPPSSWRTAVCLVGGARDFELSASSIMRRLLPSLSPRVTLFLHSPLDENSRKLWALKWAPTLASQLTGSSGNGSSSSSNALQSAAVQVDIGAVRVFGSQWVNQSVFPRWLIVDPASPKGEQGIFQYMRLVEGCLSLIREYESSHAMRFDWIVRTRVDTYWAEPPPPLSSLDPLAYTIPYGTDCGGYNDRFGVGTWATTHIALSRLSMLPAIASRGFRHLNSERSFRAQLKTGAVAVRRADLPFCVVSRREYRMPTVPVAALSSVTHLNGAKCRPCTARWEGEEAVKQLPSFVPSGLLGPSVKGLALCDASGGWEDGWEAKFDRSVGAELAAERRRIMRASREECERSFEELQRLSHLWLSPPPSALCVRAMLGPALEVGDRSTSFDTFLEEIGEASHVFSSTLVHESSLAWEYHLHRMRPGLALRPFDPNNHTHVHTDTFMDILKLSAEGFDLPVVSDWIKIRRGPSACQLLVGFPVHVGVGGNNKQRQIVNGLRQLHFHLSSCIRESGGVYERCTFFSIVHCNERHLTWPIL